MSERDDLGSDEIEAFAATIWAPDFAASVTGDHVRSFRTRMLVLPGVDEPPPDRDRPRDRRARASSRAARTVKEPEHLPTATEAVGRFLQGHTPR